MSTNQPTIEKRTQNEIIMKSGNKDIKVDIPKPRPQIGNFHPQSINTKSEQKKQNPSIEQNRSRHQSVEIEKPKPSNSILDQSTLTKISQQRDEKSNQSSEEKYSQLSIEHSKPKYSVEELLRLRPSSSETQNSILLRTRGYTLLKNYLKEMHDSGMKSNFNSRNYQILKNLQNNNATLVASDKNSFVPTILQKNVNEWDENSEKAFEMDTKTIFNRLTPQNIDQSIHELLPKIKSSERLKFMIFTFINKASSEKSFSHVYAEFLKRLSYEDEELADSIVNTATGNFKNLILNASSDNSDESELYIGYAIFISNLTKNGTIQNGRPYLTTLINQISIDESKPLNTHIIEMLFNFIKCSSKDFIRQNHQQLEIIDEILDKRKNIKSLHRFILIDTAEIINSVINDNNNYQTNMNGQDNSNQNNRNLDELKSTVRNGYASYREDYTIVPSDVSNMTSDDFLEGSMLLFLDIKDVYDFSYYQCFVLKNMQFQKINIVNLLIKYVRIFTEQKIVNDWPLIWQRFAQILCQMVIHSILTIDDAKQVQLEIFQLNSNEEKNNYNPINDIKYFIDDNFDFSEAIEFDSPDYPSPDINLALRLPKLINSKDIHIPSFPRLVSVGIIRSVFYKLVNESEDQSLNGLNNWKNLLHQTYLKQQKLFLEVLKAEIENYELDFTCDDVIHFISE